jgi:hypothetical protein
MTSFDARVEALTRDIGEEIRLMEAQLAKSAAVRRTSASLIDDTSAKQPAAKREVLPSLQSNNGEEGEPATVVSSSPSSVVHSPLHPSPSPSGTSAGVASPVVAAPIAAAHKEGTLLHLVRSGGLFGAGGTPTFVPHYIVVSGDSGIAWYASCSDYLHQPQRPLGHAAFWVETHNSRGSRFKKAAVCWPLLLQEDCPAATDPTKTYFAVDYYTASGGRDQLVLGADSVAERDAWVQVLTKYIDLYLAPRAESEELQHITRGAAVPLHRSGVIEGEAPGGTIL